MARQSHEKATSRKPAPAHVGPEHSWPVSAQQAVQIQERLARQVRRRPLRPPVRLVAGADCCYARESSRCAAAVVVWDVERRAAVETATTVAEAGFPYVPGLFAFREAPGILEALARLTVRPHVLICDGHGIAHPRRFGLASHVGVLSGIPTIGCAKGRLCGSFVEPAAGRGARSPLTEGGEIIGTVLRTRAAVRPVFVSVGHLVDLPAAETVILSCTPRCRLPEPLRLAHRAAAEALHRGSEDLLQP